MKHGLCMVFLALFAAVVLCVIAGVGVVGVSPTGVAVAAPPPLVVDKDAPLLLEEPKTVERDPWETPQGPVANNKACFVCHTNYEEEPFAVVHAKANIGCIKCHGESLAHRDDEDNITPPDIMYAPEKIKANCDKCHDEHDVPAVKVIAMWQKRCPAKTDPKTIVCTDCHGQHRLKIRTVRWDKNTRKLIIRKTKKAEDIPKKPKAEPKKK